MQNILSKLNTWRLAKKKIIFNFWYGPENKIFKTDAKEIKDILDKTFPTAEMIVVEDKSGGCAAMFEIFVESPEFKNMSIKMQHRKVYDALKEQIKVIHGLRVITKAI